MAETYAAFASKHLDVRLRSGVEWMCLCPYHEDTNPSFAINVRKGLFVCYACGVKGKVNQLADHLEATLDTSVGSSIDSVKEKAATVMAEEQPEQKVSKLWLDFWRSTGEYREMWANRGITEPKVTDEFLLGYNAREDALVIPVHSPRCNDVMSIIRRRLNVPEGGPKYLYQPGFKISEYLYGSWQVRRRFYRAKAVAITEGSIDTLALWQVGIPSVALLGARVSKTQEKLLKALDPLAYVVMTDRDSAGRAASIELKEKMRGSGIMMLEPSYWQVNCKDPAEMTEESRVQAFDSAIRLT